MKHPCLLLLAVLVLLSFQSLSQNTSVKKPREYRRTFQLAFFPGIGTNGISSGSYTNDFSINLFGGLSAGNRIFELGLVTNVELNSVSGIQLAGLANIVGANTFLNTSLSEQRDLERSGFQSNQQGIQLAGLLNYVRINGKGVQVSGGFNIVGFDFVGVQLAGLANRSGGQAQGFQISGLYNLAEDGMGGVQISSLMNYTNGQLAGMQVSLLNKAVRIQGKKSSLARSRGLQIGLLNFCKEMDGTQIGLINIGGEMHGRQIGLINFYRKAPPKENIDNGTPIGLLNFGSMGTYTRFSYNELYSLNMELTTGNCANCTWIRGSNMPYNDGWKKLNQNALVVGYDHVESTWGFGYGFQRILLNKFVTSPQNEWEAKMNERKMISFGLKFLHLNRELKLDKNFNLVSRLNLEYGRRLKWCYLFGGVALNYFLDDGTDPGDTYHIRSAVLSTGKLFGLNAFLWPGYTVGMHFK